MLATTTTQCLMCQKKDNVSNLIIEQGKKLPLIYGKIMIYLEKDALRKCVIEFLNLIVLAQHNLNFN